MALAKGWMKKDAFYGYKMEQDETAPVFLTYDELQTVMNKEFTIPPRLALVRDIFIFACFTGLAFVDVSTLKKEDMVQDNNGDWWIRKGRIKLMHRRKASSICNIPLLPVPLAILKSMKIILSVSKKDIVSQFPAIRKNEQLSQRNSRFLRD